MLSLTHMVIICLKVFSYSSAVQPFSHRGPLSQFFHQLAGRNQGGHGERAERKPIRGSGGGASSGVQGQSPWSRGQGGLCPLKLKHFLLPNFQWKPQIRPFFWNLEMQKTIKHCWILQVDFIWLITGPKLQFMWDDAGHVKSPRGPHAARGPRVRQHCPTA